MAKKIEMLNDQQEVVHPLTSSDCVIMENGKTLEEVMGDGIATPTVTHEGASFQVGVGDSNIEVVDGDVAGMTLEGQTYQNILPKPTTLIMETDEKEFKINDKIDNNIVLDDNVAEIATIKGQTYVNAVQEESANEYVAIGEELNGQSITTSGKPEGVIKNAILEGMTLVNTIQEPSEANSVVLELDADIDAQNATIDNTVQGGIHGATLKGQTLVNISMINKFSLTDGNKNVRTYGKMIYGKKYLQIIAITKNTMINPDNNNNDIAQINAYEYNSNHNFDVEDTIDSGFIGVKKLIGMASRNGKRHDTSVRSYSNSVGVLEGYEILIEYQDGMENWDIPYFEGMKSVEVPSVKTTGKNLFDGQLESGIINEHDGSLSNTSDYKRTVNYIEINPNKQYMLRVNGAVNGRCFYYDGDKKYISSSLATSNGLTNIPMNAKYMKVRFNANDIADKQEIQLEEGSTATSYEPYKSSVSTILGTNLIIDSEKGRYYHHENGNKVTDGGSRYDSYRANVEGLKRVYVKNAHSNYTFWDANMNFISGVPFVNELARPTNSQGKDGIVKVPSNAKYMRFAYDTIENNGLPCVSEVIALRKVGDVQDELDLETGKLTQRVGEVVLDGSEDWIKFGTNNGITLYYRYYDNMVGENWRNAILCDNMKTVLIGEVQPSNTWENNTITSIGAYFQSNKHGLGIYTSIGTATKLKTYLASNPLTVQYKLATPITRQVDLSIVDQSNKSLKTIQAHPTLTHITTSSQGLIPSIVIPSQLKYPTIIKPSTQYTLKLKRDVVDSANQLTVNVGGASTSVTSDVMTITTPDTLTSQDIVLTGKNNVISQLQLIEGDVTSVDYPFFEGMLDVKSPKLLATGKNLVAKTKKGAQGSNGNIIDSNRGLASIDLIKIKNGSTYVLSGYPSPSESYAYALFDKNKNYLNMAWGELLNPIDGVSYVRPFILYNTDMDLSDAYMQLEEGTRATSYEPYKGVTIEQDIDSIPLTSSMFEQGYYDYNKIIKGMSLQQLTKQDSDIRLRSKSLIPVKPNTIYKLSDNSVYIWALPFDKNGGILGGRIGTVSNTLISNFTTDANTHYIAPVIFITNSDSSLGCPDLSSLNLTLQEVTDEIVLRSIGDVKDTLNLTTGEYVQRIGEEVLDGVKYTFATKADEITGDDIICGYSKFVYAKNRSLCISDKFGTHSFTTGTNKELVMTGINTIIVSLRKDRLNGKSISQYLNENPIRLQYELKTPIIHKVNLTNTTKLPSYNSTTHYDTIVPSNSLVPNIKIPSTIDYNVAIKPSTQYTIRANTTSAMSVDLGGSTGTLTNRKVTLTTPSTLAHNSLKLGNGKAKEVMVIEGSEIKDNVPFFNGMKNVQMGGSKLVNIARFKNVTSLVTANANKTQFTYTGDGSSWGYINFDSSLLKPNTVYTLYMNIIKNEGTDSSGSIKYEIGSNKGQDSHNISAGYTGIYKKVITSVDESVMSKHVFSIAFRSTTSGNQVVIQNPMIIEGDWTHLDEIPFIESEMIIEQPIIRSQGKNLCNIPNQTLGTSYGVTVKSIDGKINISGTPNNNYGYVDIPNFLQPNKKYTYSVYENGTLNTNYRLWIRHDDGGALINPISGGMFVTRSTNISRVQFVLDNLESGVSINKDVTIQIEEGSTATTYEPFKQHTLSSNRVIGYEEECYHSCNSGAKITNTNANSMLADVEGLTVAYVTNGSSNFAFYDKDMVFISGKPYLDTGLSAGDKNGFIAVPSNAKYMRFASGINSNQATYYLKATVTGELPLRSLPNGVCDTLNLVTGEYVQRVGEIVLDGSVTIDSVGSGPQFDTTITFQTPSQVKGDVNRNDSLTGFGLAHNVKSYSENIEGFRAIGGNVPYKLFFRISKSKINGTDIQSIQNYLSQNPITVQYELATPIVRKIGLTAKGNYKEVELNGSETWNCDINNTEKIQVYIPRWDGQKFYDSVPGNIGGSTFSKYTRDDYHFHGFGVGGNYGFTIGIKPNRLYLADDILSKSFGEVAKLWKQWLSLNPVKVGYLTTNSASLYSNIQKPVFFNNVKVQFMNDNVDIQPTLTLQSRSINSYVMDMMKANTKYTLKALANPNPFTIDGTSYNATTNGTFTSPSTLSNKLLITATGVQELMIIEGDITGKNLPYYKGIRSSFDNTDKVEVLSKNKNLVKELYPMLNNNTCVIENGVVTIKGNGDGSGELNCVFNPSIYLEKDKTYTFSFSSDAQFGKTNGTDTVEAFLLKDGGTGYYIETYGFTRTFTCGATGYYNIRFDINKNNTTHKFYNIQLEESPTATPYQPHEENTTIINMPMQLETVEVIKINMVKDMEIGAINHDTGANMDSSTVVRTKNYIPVQPSMHIIYCNNGVERATHFIYYDINKNFIGVREYVSGVTSEGTVTTPDNCYFIRLYHGVTNVDNLTITKQQYKPIALNSLPNGVKDELIINRATSSAKLVRRVGKVLVDGNESGWTVNVQSCSTANTRFVVSIKGLLPNIKVNNAYVITDEMNVYNYNDSTKYPTLEEKIVKTTNEFYLYTSKADSISLLKQYLNQNPLTVYYELAEPVITEIRLKGYPFVYEDGSISLNTDIAPVTKTSYNVNQHQLINSQNETIIRHDKQISDLYDYIEIYLDEIYRMELFKMQLELSL